MALFKNEIPILEFDTEQTAVIMPGHHSDYSFPHKGLMLFMESEMVQYRKSEGYSVVEMECASMAACAKMRGIKFGELLFTADSLAKVDAHDIRNWGDDFLRQQ